MSHFKIRAITLHLSLKDSIELVSTGYCKSLEDLHSVVSMAINEGFEVWTRRLVLPFYEDLVAKCGVKLARVFELLEDTCSSERIDYAAIPLARWHDEVLDEAERFAEMQHTFMSVQYAPGYERNLTNFIKKLSEIDPVNAARFAISFGPQPVTPYFPVTRSSETGFTVSLLYPGVLKGCTLSSLYSRLRSVSFEVSSAMQEVSSSAGLPFMGVDYSLSPWMDESVAQVVEELAGCTLGEPGTLHVISKVNHAIEKVAEESCGIGFNEVMLPVAEDNRLKELVREGVLRLRDLVAFTFVCVAGVDMVVLPVKFEEKLPALMRDLYAVYACKKKCVGLRVILANSEPGDEVDLGFFGRTPVINL